MAQLRSYEWNVLCPVCGFKKAASMMKKRWDGLWVCNEDWEPRNILDFYRTRNDTHRLPFAYSDNNGVFVGIVNGSTLTPVPPGSGTLPPIVGDLIGVGIVGILIVGS